MNFEKLLSSYIAAWREVLNYEGRESKHNFQMFFVSFLISLLPIVAALLSVRRPGTLLFFSMAIPFLPLVSMIVRRLHDTGRSGRCLGQLLAFSFPIITFAIRAGFGNSVAVFGALMVVELVILGIFGSILSQEGQEGYNKYGAACTEK